jgi:hypothetical protein
VTGPALVLPAKNPMRPVLLAVLIFEVVVFGLSVPVMIFVSNVSGSLAGLAGGAAALLALVAAGFLRSPIGYYLGWLTQLVGIALGFLTYGMFIVGIMFAGLWVLTFVLGLRLERNRGTSPAG